MDIIDLSWSKAEHRQPVPFDADGNMMHYSLGYGYSKPTEVKENYEFWDDLKYMSWGRGRSAVTIWWESVRDNHRYCMFMRDLHEVMRFVNEGRLTGFFTFVKRGQNWGVKFLGKDLKRG